MANQENLDKTYMRMAEQLSQLSHAERKKVGALIVKGTQIISEGYNGTPKGFSNVCEHYNYKSNLFVKELVTRPEVLHAESNAITKLARSTNSSDKSTLYVTLAPCFDCSKLIIQAGITRVMYKDHYHNNGLAFLTKAGVEVINIYDYEDKYEASI